MRVFHVIFSLDIGGTEKQLLVILPELQKTIHNEVVCLVGHGSVGTALQNNGIPVHYLNGSGKGDIKIAIRLWKLLRQKKPSAVITYLIYADIVGRIIGRLSGIKVIIESHRSSLFGSPWWHQVDRFTRWLVTHYTSQTNVTKKLLHRVLKVPLQSITVIPNAVASLQKTSPTNEIIITCVANLKPEKDLNVLLSAFEAVYPRYPDAKLWLVGEGPERKRLQQQIASYTSKHNITFWGSQTDVPAILTKSSIFVLPTRIEGMSNALLEALSTGLPCLTSDIPVNEEIISDQHNGLLFKTGDIESLIEQLEKLLSNPELRLQLGQTAQEYAQETYSIKTVSEQWLRLLDTLV